MPALRASPSPTYPSEPLDLCHNALLESSTRRSEGMGLDRDRAAFDKASTQSNN